VAAASIEERELFVGRVLPLAVEGVPVQTVAYFGRVRTFGFKKAAQPFVEMVLPSVSTAFIQQRDIVAVLEPRQSDVALECYHLLGSVSVDATFDVAIIAISTP